VAARRQFTRGRSQRAPTAWAGFVFSDATVATATKQIVGTLTPTAGLSHETVVRIVGDWQADGPGKNGQVVLAALVVTEAAFAIGATALPDPVTDIEDDVWLFISSISVGTLGRSIHGANPIQYDSKGMRKVDEGQLLVFIVANTTDGNVGISGYTRVLTKVAIRS